MSKIMNSYETKLQTADVSEISAILDAKLEATSPNGVADYVGLAIDNIKVQIERIKQAEKELKAIRAQAEQQLDLVGEGVAEWLADAGIDKLNGDYVSSISISSRKEKEELSIINEESLINRGYFKTVLDKTAVKNAVKNGIITDDASISITHLPDTTRVNKRIAKTADLDES